MRNLKNFKAKKIYIQVNINKRIKIHVEEPGLTVAWLNNKFFKHVAQINDFSVQRKTLFKKINIKLFDIYI